MRITKILCLLCLAVTLGQACQNVAPKKAETPAFTATPYWVTSSFIQALNADSDSLVTSNCMELQFTSADSVIIISCDFEAAYCVYHAIDDKTIEISGEMLGDAVFKVKQVADNDIALVGWLEEGQEIHFEPAENHEHDTRGSATRLVGKHLAGTYTRENPFGRDDATAPVTINADGSVKGFGAYKYYQTALGGDLAAAEDGSNLIYFSAEGQEMFPLAWSKRGDTLNLWTLENMSAADEKPFYAVGRMYDRLIRKK
ncbi:hypothetical protein [Haliscomenobacter sp.]|uniref:hypothetical protein n=1 Tax=Haliscomenobacter sp. TaxID=2717303 RepID=UPI003593D290